MDQEARDVEARIGTLGVKLRISIEVRTDVLSRERSTAEKWLTVEQIVADPYVVPRALEEMASLMTSGYPQRQVERDAENATPDNVAGHKIGSRHPE